MRWVRIEAADDGVRSLVLDKPPVNALGRELVDDLTEALTTLARDADARCLVLRSAGKHFCAGADLKERKGMTLDDVRGLRQPGRTGSGAKSDKKAAEPEQPSGEQRLVEATTFSRNASTDSRSNQRSPGAHTRCPVRTRWASRFRSAVDAQCSPVRCG